MSLPRPSRSIACSTSSTAPAFAHAASTSPVSVSTSAFTPRISRRPAPHRLSPRVLPVCPAPAGRRRVAASLSGWDLVRRAAAAAGVAGALFVGGGVSSASAATGGAAANPQHRRQAVVASASSEVEAAAVTLGAVTVGGLAVKGVLRLRRDPERELREVEEASARAQAEEEERMKRRERNALEAYSGEDGAGSGVDDEVLMEDFLSRVASLGDSESVEEGEEGAAAQDADRRGGVLRDFDFSGKPGKGGENGAGASGSMVMERPGDGVGGEDGEGGESGAEENVAEADKESLDMLKRMWSLDSPDDKERGKNKQ